MAHARLTRPPTCLDCLRRLAHPSSSPAAAFSSPPSFLALQTRGAKSMTKAEEDDLQGIPVRLLKDIPGFGRKHAIIRVKPGRMRNYWFPKAHAEYMTRQRFQELGLTEAAIGVRDRSFGTRVVLEDDGAEVKEGRAESKKSKKDTLTLPPEETLALLETLLPPILTFARKPIPATVSAPLSSEYKPAPPPPPPTPRSPSLAANAAASTAATGPEQTQPAPTKPDDKSSAATAIFGSVSASDILAAVRERLLEADPAQGGRVALDAESVRIEGLGLEGAGDDRIKHLGAYDVLIYPAKDSKPVVRQVQVVPEE
ncbi:uncharacterized protein F4812DRAFT_401674 [Daldinia caldariorum]|uniref:uncharacterized protein n=1 Tax=Daldinia caldariorum TaxID=326644 RepID=UPI0020081374|nr:uncharacterized protein F4812DRAFT_401674 [Daldinia caldariorum]KAI1467579.1 hypothetical protein F4812DRAFT_401674 [Daldinia caldariorum]